MAEIAGPVPVRQANPVMARSATAARVRTRVLALPLHQRFLAALILLYLAKAIILVFVFPPFSGHDETAHYSYIRTVVDEHRVPTLTQDPAMAEARGTRGNDYVDLLPPELYPYCRYTLQWWCDPMQRSHTGGPVYVTEWGSRTNTQADGVQYAANHPPLYYLIMAPVYWLSEQAGAGVTTQMYLLRLAAIPFGLIVVLLAYLTTRLIFPRDTFLLITVPAFVALQTQVSYEATMINNDIVAIAAFSWVLYLVVRAIRDRFPARTSLLIGFALGLGIVTKSTSLSAAAFVGVAMLTLLGFTSLARFRASLPKFIGTGLLIAAPAIALAAPWYIHMYRTYGNFTALPQILELQHMWNTPDGSFFQLLFSVDFFKMRFSELWGEYGWRVLPFAPHLMQLIAVPTLLAVLGFVVFTVRTFNQSGIGDHVGRLDRWQFWALAIMLVACVVGYLFTVQFGTQFALTQARYFFPVINALAILLMLGLRTLIPARWHLAGAATLITALVALNVFVVSSYVIPYYWL